MTDEEEINERKKINLTRKTYPLPKKNKKTFTIKKKYK